MTPDNPLLKALLANPDDDTLRLAIADWCDENDQPARAEFIRVQVEFARGGEDRERRNHLEIRQRDLLVANEAEWVRPLWQVLAYRPEKWGGWVFRRGFVEYLRLRGDDFVYLGHRLAALTPLRELDFEGGVSGQLEMLCRQPWLRSVTHMYGVHISDHIAEVLVACPYLSDLRHLEVVTCHLSEGVGKRFRRRFASALPRGA
jgi:uncharacterized protein (TIGR02996 family)